MRPVITRLILQNLVLLLLLLLLLFDDGLLGSMASGVWPQPWHSFRSIFLAFLTVCSVYNRLMAAIGRPDMGIENMRYATDALRCDHEGEICEVSGLAPSSLFINSQLVQTGAFLPAVTLVARMNVFFCMPRTSYPF